MCGKLQIMKKDTSLQLSICKETRNKIIEMGPICVDCLSKHKIRYFWTETEFASQQFLLCFHRKLTVLLNSFSSLLTKFYSPTRS